MGIFSSFAVIIFSSFFIYLFGKRFAESSSEIGTFFNMSKSVKGATLDAISSSAPELFIALYSVIFFKKFEMGLGTILGSAMYNLLVIPGLCVFFAPAAFRISKKIISRDILFYVISLFLLFFGLFYFRSWGIVLAIVFLGVYVIYLFAMKTSISQRKKSMDQKKILLKKEISIFILTFAAIGIFSYALTEASINLANLLHIPAFLIAFSITAIATSVPDTVISVVNAKKGSSDDATSNVLGSNTFNILVGLGLPLLIYSLMSGSIVVGFNNFGILAALFVSTLIVTYFLRKDYALDKKEGAILLGLYILFLAYVILVGFNIL